MLLKIVQVGEPVLREHAREITPDEIRGREIQELIAWMRETMYEAPGVGLAAPQIAKAIQLAVIEDKAEYMEKALPELLKERERHPVPFQVIINPKITLHEGDRAIFHEGCLSLAGFTAAVPRARRVTVECLDHNAKARTIQANGWYARILQHEIDHLYGTLYVDRMDTKTFATVENFTHHSGGVFGKK
jgi:peptide deformylase